MIKFRFSFLIVVLGFSAITLEAQGWRGTGRISGTVVDPEGKPVEGAVLRLRAQRAGNTGPDVKSDKKGKWAAGGLIGGGWNIDVEADGFLLRQLSVQISETQRIPPMEIRLDRAAKPEPEPEPEL